LIRPARRDDARVIAEVNFEAGAAAWGEFIDAELIRSAEPPVERWVERLEAPGEGFVAEEDGEVVGFCFVRAGDDGAVGEVTGLYTRPSVWGRGFGRELLEHGLDALRARGCREATLWTERRNRRPLAFYRASGWQPDGAARRREFLGTEIEELRLRKSLEED